jgi:CubicO group peptidase (beta-lactamase class C family)
MLEKAVKQPIATYMTTRLWELAGMESDGFWIADGPPAVGSALSGMGFNAVARDYARIGQLMLQKGRARQRQIIPADWVEQSTASVATDGKSPMFKTDFPIGYGLQWWTLHGTGAYMALGLQGQFTYVDPQTETVAVKLSYFPPGDTSALENETFAFLRAASSWNP